MPAAAGTAARELGPEGSADGELESSVAAACAAGVPAAAEKTAAAARVSGPVGPRVTAKRPGRRGPGRWGRLLLVGAVGAAGGVLTVAALALWRPGWYRVPVIPAEREQAVRDDLQAMADGFTAALLGEERFGIEFSERQLCEWITMRGRIWPAARETVPRPWADPLVRLTPGRITVGASFDAVVGSPVVSVELAAAMEGENILVRVEGCRVGAIPIPVSWVADWASGLIVDRVDSRSGVRVYGNVAEGFRVGTRQTWWNGRRDYRVCDVMIGAERIGFVVEPLGARR